MCRGEEPDKAEREAALMQRVAHEHVCKLFEHSMLGGSLHTMVWLFAGRRYQWSVHDRSATV